MKITLLTALLAMGSAVQAYAGALTVPTINNTNSVQVVRDPAQSAEAFLRQAADELKLQDGTNDLQVESVTESPIGYHVRFSQTKGGLPVDQAGIVVTLNHANQVVSYTSDYQPQGDSKAAPRFDIPADKAVELAYANEKLTASPTDQTVEQKVLVIDGVSRPVYVIQFAAPVDKKWSWEVVVDAASGQIHRSRSLAYDAGRKKELIPATVFAPNPTIKSGHKYGDVDGYSDNDNKDSTFFDSMMTPVKIEVESANGKYNLNGKYAKLTDQESPKNPDCTAKKADMSFHRNDPCFDAVSAFYFITDSLTYLNEKLGIKAVPLKYTGGVHFDPKGLSGDDNSHYDERKDEIAYGEGGIDDAQDHDVVIHELGHAIHSWVTKGHISQAQGLSEGIGDYWAASYSRSFMKKGHVAYDWTFSFDGHNEFWPGRSVAVTGKYPEAAQGEVHDAGELWATVNIEIWDAIGKEKSDKIFWTGISMLSGSSNQLDAAKAIIVAAKNLYPQDKALQDTVVAKFKARGYPVQ